MVIPLLSSLWMMPVVRMNDVHGGNQLHFSRNPAVVATRCIVYYIFLFRRDLISLVSRARLIDICIFLRLFFSLTAHNYKHVHQYFFLPVQKYLETVGIDPARPIKLNEIIGNDYKIANFPIAWTLCQSDNGIVNAKTWPNFFYKSFNNNFGSSSMAQRSCAVARMFYVFKFTGL